MLNNLFLSVGAMKAGTTWLYEQLKNHQDIYFTPEKEIHYFYHVNGSRKPLHINVRREKLLHLLSNKNKEFLSHNLNTLKWYFEYASQENINDVWYQKLFIAKQQAKYAADFSNLYSLLDENGWRRVKQNCNNLKVIYTLRDPISRIWSHYKFEMKFNGKEDNIFDLGFEHFKEILNKDWFWMHAEYHKVIKSLQSNLTKDELLILSSENFRTQPIKELNKITNFLGLSPLDLTNANTLNNSINATKSIPIPDDWKEYLIDKTKDIYIFYENILKGL